VTVQVLTPPELKLDGLHCNDVTATGGNKVTEVVSVPAPKLAVITTVCVVLMVPALAVNEALVAPAATVTEPGTLTRKLLSLRVIGVLDGAG